LCGFSIACVLLTIPIDKVKSIILRQSSMSMLIFVEFEGNGYENSKISRGRWYLHSSSHFR
jgi:hypothetical protein